MPTFFSGNSVENDSQTHSHSFAQLSFENDSHSHYYPRSFLVETLLIMVLKPILTPISPLIMIIITSLFLYIMACYLYSLHRLFRVKIFPIISDIYITCARFFTSCAKKCLIISTIYRRLAQACARFCTPRKLRACLKCF